MSAILDTIRTFKLSGYIRIAWIRGRYPEYRPQLPLRREVSVSRNTIHPNISMGSRNFEGFAWPSSHRTNSTAYYGIASTLLRSIGLSDPLLSVSNSSMGREPLIRAARQGRGHSPDRLQCRLDPTKV